jgi:tetratricopeptide (TPR) repeat protein
MATTLFGGGVIPVSPSNDRQSRSKTRLSEAERPSLAEQRPIHELYGQGRFLAAYELAAAHGPLTTWTGTMARLLAGSLASRVGGIRLGQALHLKAARLDPQSPMARCFAAGALVERLGAARAWAWIRRHGEMPADAPAEFRADWLVLEASIAARFRDFDKAWSLVRRADDIAPPDTWRLLQRTWILERQDEYDEALEAAQKAHQLDSSDARTIAQLARLLHIAGRADEATALLQRSMADSEWGGIAGMLAGILVERGRHEESLRALARFEALSPLLERQGQQWLAAQRADALYEAGDIDGAREQARLARSGFHDAVFERVARTKGDAGRVLVRVPFVQQRHKTCSPASLTSLSRYWRRPLDQDDLAEAMSYDGTPHHAVLTWGRANGWVARDFRVTWESARALLDRGIPFAISTAGSMGAHRQVVVGYDARRGTFKVRCPSQPFLVEFLAEAMIEEQRWTGPIGLVWLPAEEEGRLAGIQLPDAADHDDMHALQVALLANKRAAAGEIQRGMERKAPGTPLTIWARHLLAVYDRNPETMLSAIDALVGRFPDTVRLQLGRLSLLEHLSPPAEYARALADLLDRHPNDPAVVEIWLRRQSGGHPARARLMLRTMLRRLPAPSALLLYLFAGELHAQGQAEVAQEIGRFAACLEDKDEIAARVYFGTMQARGSSDEGLAFLQKRFDAHGGASAGPALTLVWALEQLDRGEEAVAVLERALTIRPRDADLRLAAADSFGRRGDFTRAEELLAAARGCTRRGSWLRVAAAVAAQRNDQVNSLRLWRAVLDGEPWAADANRAVATLLAASGGRDAGASYLASVYARFSRHQDLSQVLDDWARETEALRQAELTSRNAVGSDGLGGSTMLYPVLLMLLMQIVGRSCVQ